MMELHARSHPVCHSCSGKISRLGTIPNTVAGIRDVLNRERRGVERRAEEADRRIFPRERRVGERRTPPRSGSSQDTDPRIALPDFEDIVIELQEADIESVEQTLVRERL